MKKIFINLILLIAFTFCANEKLIAIEHPHDSTRIYKINYWVTGIIDIGGTAANYFSINRIWNKKAMTDADFLTLNKSSFTKFDQWAFHQDLSKRNQNEIGSSIMLGGTAVLPLLLSIDKKIRKNFWDILLMYYEMHMVTFGIYNYSFLGPTFQNKYRPIVYYDQLTYDQRRTGKNKSSFYSGHTASTAAASFFMAKVYSDYHPELCWKKYLLYAAASVPPLVDAWLRVKALKHFPSDNLVGLGVGAFVGILVPELHKIKRRGVSLSMYSSVDGAGLSLVWNPEYKNQETGLRKTKY